MLVSKKNLPGYKEHIISFVGFSFLECVNIICWLENIKLYVSDVEESYRGTIIVNMANSGKLDLSLHIVQCWRACVVNEENQYLTLVLYCSHIMYKYYARCGFSPINTQCGR